MSKGSSSRKSKFLGVPYGTACGQLRKKILWKFVVQCNEDICFRCKTKIENISEMSIEHKLPWENVDTDLFWDLDNIAFSHLRCNVRLTFPKQEQFNLICAYCSIAFKRRKGGYRKGIHATRNNDYCCLSHAVKGQHQLGLI